MESNSLLFLDLTYIFLAAAIGGAIAWRLRLPLILGFVFGGVVVSPFTPGPHLSNLQSFEVLAEVGVVLLMFSIGFEFSIRALLRVKWVALLGGPIGVLLILASAFAVGRIAGWPVSDSLVIGAAVSVASTMVMARMLTDAGKLATTYGRVMIGITLVEDLAVIFMIVAIPAFAGSQDGQFWKAARILGKALLLLIPLVFLAIRVIPRLLRRIKGVCNSELFLLATISICLGTAALAHAAGFSVALGAFLAGLSISGSEDLHDAHTQIIPLRDAFVALFFVSLGALIDPRTLRHSLPLLGLMLLIIILAKFVVWAGVVKAFRYPLPVAIAVAAGLTQIGELSFVLIQSARAANMIRENVFGTVIAASLISIFLNMFIVRAAFAWTAKNSHETSNRPPSSLCSC